MTSTFMHGFHRDYYMGFSFPPLSHFCLYFIDEWEIKKRKLVCGEIHIFQKAVTSKFCQLCDTLYAYQSTWSVIGRSLICPGCFGERIHKIPSRWTAKAKAPPTRSCFILETSTSEIGHLPRLMRPICLPATGIVLDYMVPVTGFAWPDPNN